MSTFLLRIVTPDGEKFRGEAEKFSFRATDGEVGILANHSDYIAPVDICKVYITGGEGKELSAVCGGGFMTFSNNTASLVCDTFILSEESDLAAVTAELKDVEEKLEGAKNQREKNILISHAKRLKLQIELVS